MNPSTIKKWFPFILLVTAAIVLSLYFYIFEQSNPYTPSSDDPAIIYQEACAHCHGERGEGTGLLYPGLADEILEPQDVIQSVKSGDFLMPTFPNLNDSLLAKLADYVAERQYLDTTSSSDK